MAHHFQRQFGNYRLLRTVGSGGFATVYLGEHIHLGTQAAIKVLRTEMTPEQREAFRAEARTIARLVHPHIVRVLDFGVQRGTPFLVVEYAPYGSLRELVPAQTPLPLARILPYVKQVADALQYAHQQRVIHRDVKPENMLLGAQGQVLLGDFGLAVIFSSARQDRTFDFAGTVAYIAPEQIRGEPCPASDQYALGVVVYQWLAGTLPFQGSLQEILLQHLASNPPLLRARGADISLGVEAVVYRALAKEPGHRFASVEAFATALQQAAQGGEQGATSSALQASFARDLTPSRRAPQHALVGRERELRLLGHMLESVGGEGRQDIAGEHALRHPCVLLAGDPGIGKTRLAEEISDLARQQGWAVVWGRAHSPEQQLVYRIWIDVLRSALAYGYWPWQEVSASPERYQPLASLLPELAEISGARGEILEPTQFRIWDAVQMLFVAIASHAPLLVVLDDLQWVDTMSCSLLGYLVRTLAGKRVLLVGTGREQEISVTHPLRPLLDQTMTVLHLPALNASQIGQLVAHLPPSVAEDIQKQAAGNPFFAEELARFPRPAGVGTDVHLVSDAFARGGALPPRIVDIFEQRVAHLSQATQKMLGHAAVLGPTFAFDVLRVMQQSEHASECEEETLLDQLDEALRARLLLEEQGGMQLLYHFWHPLLVDYLYLRLSAARRARLHGRAARALLDVMKQREEEAAATIVYHLVQSGSEPSLLVHYARLAGEHAHRLAAYPEAKKQYRLALAHLREDTATRAYLVERLGECTMIQGKFEEARACYEQALALRSGLSVPRQREQDEAQLQALFACEIGKTWHYCGKTDEAQRAYLRGERTLRAAQVVAGPAWAKIRFEEGYNFWRHGDVEKAWRLANEALALFEQALRQESSAAPLFLTRAQRTLRGNPVDLGRVYVLLAAIEATTGQSANGLQHLQAALEIYQRYEDLAEVAVIYINQADLYLRQAEYAQAQAALVRACDLAEKRGDMPNLSVGYVNMGVLAARWGDLVEAEAWYRRALQLAEQLKDPFYTSLFGSYVALTLIEQGNLDQARRFLLPALKISWTRRFAPGASFALVVHAHLRIALARAAHRQTERDGSLARARCVLQHALSLGQQEAETRIEGAIALAEVLFLSGSLQVAGQQARSALQDAHAHQVIWLQLRASHLLGTILTARGSRAEGDSLFQQAIEDLHTRGMRLEYARALRNYGVVLLQRPALGDVDLQRGRGYLAQARDLLLACGATSDAEGVQKLLR